MTDETARAAREADDATRGSAVKLAAEVASRLLGLGTTLLLARALGVSDFGALGRLWYVALLLAELAEFGLQATATRALVAGTFSLKALARARVVTSALLAGAALVALPASQAGPGWVRAAVPILVPLVLFFVLAGWGEFLGVALRCRGARVGEALLLLVLRGGSLAGAVVALLGGAGLVGIAWGQAISPLPALALGAWLLGRRKALVHGADAGVGSVLRAAVPMAAHGGLQMLSPRVEFLVLSLLAGDRETGVFLAALRVFEFLGMVPNAVAQGAMPALTREALHGGEGVRRRTAGTMALVAAPAATGLALVAPGVVGLLFGVAYADGRRAAAPPRGRPVAALHERAPVLGPAGQGPGRVASAPDRAAGRGRAGPGARPRPAVRGGGRRRRSRRRGVAPRSRWAGSRAAARASTSGSLGRSGGRSSPACRWRWP